MSQVQHLIGTTIGTSSQGAPLVVECAVDITSCFTAAYEGESTYLLYTIDRLGPGVQLLITTGTPEDQKVGTRTFHYLRGMDPFSRFLINRANRLGIKPSYLFELMTRHAPQSV